jgi:hypothetical protein
MAKQCENFFFGVWEAMKNCFWEYLRHPDMVYVLKMEYVSKINIFGLKMMVKSGLEKIFLKFLHAQGLFQTS